MSNDNGSLDKIVRTATAFRSWADLIRAIETNQYIPTLIPKGSEALRAATNELRARLRLAGHAVFPPESQMGRYAKGAPRRR